MAPPIPNVGLGGRHIYTASTLPPGKCPGCPFNRILVGPQSRPGRWAEEKERTTSSVDFPGRCPPMWCWWNWMEMEKCAYFNICGWRGMTVLHCCVVYGSEHITLFCCFLLNGEMVFWIDRAALSERPGRPRSLSLSSWMLLGETFTLCLVCVVGVPGRQCVGGQLPQLLFQRLLLAF